MTSPVTAEITKDQLIAQITALTENQNNLIQTIASLERRAKDPFLNFVTPDPIKNIPNFNGNRKETLAWIEDTQQTLDLFEEYEDEPTYKQIMRVVRSKIIGEAREVLIASGNPKEWEDIKEILLNSFGDKRDITSHIQSLFFIKQGKLPLIEYYHKLKSIDTAIKSSAAQLDDYKKSMEAVNKLISLMSLTRYIDGLNGEQISMYVRSYRPKTLEEAHDITMQHLNATFRQKMENRQFPSLPKLPETKPQNNTSHPKFNQQNSHNKFNGSGKFRNNKQNHDDDVSMRTAKSRLDQVNQHEAKHKQNEEEYDPPSHSDESVMKPDDSTLDSDDDSYFVDDELNFQVVDAHEVNR